MTYFSKKIPEIIPSSKQNKYRARFIETGQFLHASGDSLTSNEDFAWYGTPQQFKALKATKVRSGIWGLGKKWTLTRRSGFTAPAPQNTRRAL